jgi:hypothetical protein
MRELQNHSTDMTDPLDTDEEVLGNRKIWKGPILRPKIPSPLFRKRLLFFNPNSEESIEE